MEYLFFILINTLVRLMPHLPNMTSVGATALFLSAKYSWKKSFLVTCITMLLSDAILGFHSVMWATYGSFLIVAALGTVLRKKNDIRWILTVTFLSSLQFFILTNFAVWMTGTLYPRTMAGLLDCYVMALPFFRNTLLGDMTYTAIFFGCFEIFRMKWQSKKAFFLEG